MGLGKRMWYAHALEGGQRKTWEPLEDHLREVAKLAAEFAEAFNARSWGDFGRFLT